jgi:hypothetical protein
MPRNKSQRGVAIAAVATLLWVAPAALFGGILSVTRSGDGSGTVKSESLEAAIDCGSQCSDGIPDIYSATLRAIPGPGSHFAGWSGACTGQALVCIVAPGEDEAGVDAAFTQTQPERLTWAEAISGFYGASIAQTEDGGYILAGSSRTTGPDGATTSDPQSLLKLDADGVVVWHKRYPAGSATWVERTSYGYAAVGNGDLTTVSPDGSVLWIKPLGADVSSLYRRPNDDFTLPGYVDDTGTIGQGHLWVGGVNQSGQFGVSEQYYYKQGFILNGQKAVAALVTPDTGNIVVAGSGTHGADGALMKLWPAPVGAEWSTELPGAIAALEPASDGGYVVGGSALTVAVPALGRWLPWLAKVDEDGTLLWQKTYTSQGGIQSVRRTLDGGYVVTGYQNIDYFHIPTPGYAIWVAKLAADGTLEWDRVFGPAYVDNGMGKPDGSQSGLQAVQTGDGGYAVVGGYFSPPPYQSYSWTPDSSYQRWRDETTVLKLDADGNLDGCSPQGFARPFGALAADYPAPPASPPLDFDANGLVDRAPMPLQGSDGAATTHRVCTGIPYPKLRISPAGHDFGAISLGTEASRSFSLANLGSVELTLNGVRLDDPWLLQCLLDPSMWGLDDSAQCLDWPDHGFTLNLWGGSDPCGAATALAAGDSCTVSVGFAPAALSNGRPVRLSVDTNDPSAQGVDIGGSGVASNPLVSPQGLDFASAASPAQTVIVRNLWSTQSLDGLAVSLGGAHASQFRQTNDCGPSLAPGAQCLVTLSYLPDRPTPLPKTATLRVAAAAPGSLQQVALKGNLSSAPALRVWGHDFGSVLAGTVQTHLLSVKNLGAAPVKIATVAISGAAAFGIDSNGCLVTLNPGKTCTLRVHFAPGSFGSLKGVLALTSNDPGLPSRAVDLKGIGSGPKLAVSPTQHAFGAVAIGGQALASLSLSNLGDRPLNIASIARQGGAAFKQTNDCPASLPSGASCAVEVSFSPKTAGAKLGRIEVTSDDPKRPLLKIQLTGSGS